MAEFELQVISLIFIILLIIVYFSKRNMNIDENKYYNIMLICSLIIILINSFLHVFAYIVDFNIIVTKYLILYEVLNKVISLVFIIFFGSLFSYTLAINNKLKLSTKTIDIIMNIFYIIFTITLFFTKIQLRQIDEITTSYGSALDISYLFASLILFGTMLVVLLNIKNLDKRYYVVFAIFILIICMAVSTIIFPQLILIDVLLVLTSYIMYFTIENPDVKMLEQISLAKDQAEKANAAKTDFLSSMSHEIRTPLNAIVGFSEAIKEEETLEAAKQDAKDIILASQNLLEIVNGILDISKIEANKMEIVNTEYDLVEECKLIAKLIKPRIGEKPIELEVNIAPDIPHTLYGDKSKVKEILSNLLTNAVKYTESGTISFNVSCINKNDECSLVFSVEDTGRGIKPEKIDHLFKKFERLEEDRNTTVEGAGLGLAITKSLVEMMDGKIIVQSVFGSGSKFTVYLKQKIIPEKRYHLNSDFAKEPLDLSGKRILIVDDNELNIKVAERLLKKYNLIIDTCSSGVSCLEKIQDGEIYDLILMDDMMPKMSGTETLHLLKEIPSFKTRVVALTANAIEGMKEKYLSVGFDDYLSKPMENKEVDRILRKFLNKEYHPSEFAPLPDDFYEISETAILNINNLEEKAKK